LLRAAGGVLVCLWQTSILLINYNVVDLSNNILLINYFVVDCSLPH
jgi:hypothetical protein